MSWNDLSMSERADYIRLGVMNGITSLDNIRNIYNEYKNGGPKPKAYARAVSELPKYSGMYTDSNGNKSTKANFVYVDEGGKPIPTKALDSYELTRTKWKSSLKSTGQTMLEDADTEMTRKAKADQYASQFTPLNLLGAAVNGINFLSPSQQYGAIVDWAQGDRGYWEGIGSTNSGFFTDKFAEKHPYWTIVGNMVGDAALGLAGLDALEIATKGTKLSRVVPKIRLRNRPEPEIERRLNKVAKKFYEENIVPKLASIGLDEYSLPTLYHTDAHSSGFNNLPIKVKKDKNFLPRVAGYHHTITGDNIIYTNTDNLKSTAIHEAASHGTDQLLPSNVINFYKEAIGVLPNKNKFLRWIFGSKGANNWYELRATKNEIERFLKIRGADANDLTDKELVKIMKRINAYGTDYYLDIKNPSSVLNESFGDYNTYSSLIKNPDKLRTFNTPYRRSQNPFIDRLRYAIKYLPAVTLPAITYTGNEKVQ